MGRNKCYDSRRVPACEKIITAGFCFLILCILGVVGRLFFLCRQVGSFVDQGQFDEAANILKEWECSAHIHYNYLSKAPNQIGWTELSNQLWTIKYLLARTESDPETTYHQIIEDGYNKAIIADTIQCKPSNLDFCRRLELHLPQIRPKIIRLLPLDKVFELYDDGEVGVACMHRCLDFGDDTCKAELERLSDPHKYTYLLQAAFDRRNTPMSIYAILNDAEPPEITDDNVNFAQLLISPMDTMNGLYGSQRYAMHLMQLINDYEYEEARMEFILDDDDDEY